MDFNDEKDAKKAHRVSKSGRKADKRSQKNKTIDKNLTPKQRNPKAFAIQNVVKAERFFRRTQDIKAKRQHMPEVDHTPLEPPPLIVAIVGPPKVGKSILLRCLIKNFTRQNMSEIKGPVTVVSGKKKRLTFIECNNDINVMIDVAKIADLVLLLVDASFGFEMEIFEFLNICQIHGFPRIMGVLTHLDYYRNNKQLRKMKKSLKHRFWTEIYQGAKLFYLSGMIHNEYQRTEIHNLGRFISVMKIRPIHWRTTHPYLLADRLEDLTDPEKIRQHPKTDRNVCFYGYSRGANFRNRNSIHIPGCGDFVIKDVSFLPDPCPLPDKEKKRSLNEKERLIYAPFAGVGGIVYDKDAVYIDVGGSHSHTEQKPKNGGYLSELVSSLIESQDTLHNKMASSQLQIFRNTATITSEEAEKAFETDVPHTSESTDSSSTKPRRKVIFDDEVENSDEKKEITNESDEETDDDDESEGDTDDESDGNITDESEEEWEESDIEDEITDSVKRKASESDHPGTITKKQKITFAEDCDESDDVNVSNKLDDGVGWKTNLVAKAAKAFYERQRSVPNLRKLVYGKQIEMEDTTSQNKTEELGGLFKVLRSVDKAKSEDKITGNLLDCTKFVTSDIEVWSVEKIQQEIKDCFVTGKWKDCEDAQTLLDRDDELYGDFEDLEEDKEKDDDSNDDDEVVETNQTDEEKRLEKKLNTKKNFDLEYDGKEGESSYYDDLKNELDQQTQLNKNEFLSMDDDLRVQLEGYRPGMYLRIEVSNVPCELVTNFDPNYPLILGGLQSGEDNIGFVNVRFKKHRWYKKILKTRDPVIISLGWRRFQTLPLYSMQDHNGRCRLLKYTPEHLHCLASFWGPITPQSTGCLAIQSVSDVTVNFRIAATGVITELDKSTQIMKKLKLTGIPYKIYKKTAFIKGMFNTAIEVTKFEGAAIRTVSGIRGQIKKASKTLGGSFRATFEDKIIMSDIVFMRTWYRVQVPQFYNPVTSMLLPQNEKSNWRGMRTMRQLRLDYNIPIPVNDDSIYKPVQRAERIVAPIVIPKALQKELPYRDKPKAMFDKRKISLNKQRVAIVQEPQEKKVSQLMKMIKTVYQAKQRRARETMRDRVVQHKKALEESEFQKNERQKKAKKELFRALGKIKGKRNQTASS